MQDLSIQEVYNPVEALPDVSVFPQIVEQRDRIVGRSAIVGRVTNADENQRAFNVQQALVTFDKFLDEARQFAKKPAWDRCVAIDSLARSLRDPVKSEITRLARLIGNYQANEEARIKAEQAAARADLDRLERERQNALAAAPTLDARDTVQETFNNLASALPMPLPPPKPKGQSLRWTWEIVIVDPVAFVCAHPELAEVSIKKREATALLDAGKTFVGVTATKIPEGRARAMRG